ncbi:MAG: hypothetical protein HY043_12235 [Verrucomicrobia bacterium]|nr:hypothetical protein [Verrucomicrobiota bacterium]
MKFDPLVFEMIKSLRRLCNNCAETKYRPSRRNRPVRENFAAPVALAAYFAISQTDFSKLVELTSSKLTQTRMINHALYRHHAVEVALISTQRRGERGETQSLAVRPALTFWVSFTSWRFAQLCVLCASAFKPASRLRQRSLNLFTEFDWRLLRAP